MFTKRLKELRKARGLSQGALAKELGLSQQAVGKWETGRSTPDPATLAALASFFKVSVDYLLGCGAAPMPGSVLPYLAAEECQIPVIGTVRAGFGALAFEEDYGTEPASVKDPDSYFREGDLALVHRQQTLENGELGVLVYGEGEGTLKKFVRRGNAIILQPFNPAYQPQVILGEDLEHLHVVGKVVETKAKW